MISRRSRRSTLTMRPLKSVGAPHFAAADQIGLLIQIDEQLDIVRHPAGERRRIEAEHQRHRHIGCLEIFGDRDRRIRAGRMADQDNGRGRAAIIRDDLAGEIAGRIHGVHGRLDAALLDARRQIVEAEREHLADQAAQQIDMARNAARRGARRGSRDRIDARAAASGDRQSKAQNRDDEIRAPAHPRSRWWRDWWLQPCFYPSFAGPGRGVLAIGVPRARSWPGARKRQHETAWQLARCHA